MKNNFDKRKGIKSLDSAINILEAYVQCCDYDDKERRDTERTIRGLERIKNYLK